MDNERDTPDSLLSNQGEIRSGVKIIARKSSSGLAISASQKRGSVRGFCPFRYDDGRAKGFDINDDSSSATEEDEYDLSGQAFCMETDGLDDGAL